MERKQTLLDEYVKRVEASQKKQMKEAYRFSYLAGGLFLGMLVTDVLLFRWAKVVNLSYTPEQIFFASLCLSGLFFAFMEVIVVTRMKSIKVGQEVVSQFKQHIETFQESLVQVETSEKALKKIQESVNSVLSVLDTSDKD